MTGRGWQIYLTTMALAIVAFVAVPVGPWINMACSLAIAYLACAAIIVTARRLPRGDRLAWYLLAFGIFANTTADVPQTFLEEVVGSDAYPSIADAFYLSLYPACVIAIGLMIRRRPPQWVLPALLDTATITAGISILGWVYAIQPAFEDTSYSLFGRLVRVAYPIGDILLIAMTLLLARSDSAAGGPRDVRWRTSPPWIAAALLVFLGGDLIWLVIGDASVASWVERGIDGVYFAAFLLLGYAVRHARTTDELGAESFPARPGRGLMITLLTALLMAPLLLVAEVSRGAFHHGLAIAAGSTVMSVLVIARLSLLLRQAERQESQVRELSRRDELTGLPNRRAWIDELPRALESSRQSGIPVSVSMMDLDHFKSFNDAYGHPAGDRLLKEAAAAWHSCLRQSDILARYGGEEFIVLLPGADIEQAVTVMDRVRTNTPAAQTFSSGVATWDTHETSEELIARADAALYEAKHSGRNRIVAAGMTENQEADLLAAALDARAAAAAQVKGA
jgi:diguanylate cyclase (GGDEF)-like protein